MKYTIFNMTEKDRQRFIEVTGKTMLWLEERRSIQYIADNLNLEPWQVYENIDEMMYILRNHVGKRRFFKMLFVK